MYNGFHNVIMTSSLPSVRPKSLPTLYILDIESRIRSQPYLTKGRRLLLKEDIFLRVVIPTRIIATATCWSTWHTRQEHGKVWITACHLVRDCLIDLVDWQFYVETILPYVGERAFASNYTGLNWPGEPLVDSLPGAVASTATTYTSPLSLFDTSPSPLLPRSFAARIHIGFSCPVSSLPF